uniref:Putative ovule protein n=1 Tax=Solanum chacoense TaxID=4108 RepID=A0A0V0GTA0_SOLCH
MVTRKTEKGRLQRANKQQNQSFHPCQHDETKNFSTNILSPSLFMVHDTSCRERSEQSSSPSFNLQHRSED